MQALRRSKLLIPSLLFVVVSGCSTLIGNVKPVDERSDKYGVVDLSSPASDWSPLRTGNNRPEGTAASEVGDVAFQNKKTGSTISLTSGCRPTNELGDQSLSDFTQPILLGISEPQQKLEKAITVANVPALETTVRGKSEGEPIVIRAVVLQKKACVYDLTLIAVPKFFDQDLPSFVKFTDSLRLRD